jgi:glycosyltransferase involved in cell wall biosynthesis
MQNLKVALKGDYLPEIGGVSIHVSRLAEALYNDGVLYCVYSNTASTEHVESRFLVKNVSHPKIKYGVFRSLFWFISVLRDFRFDIIHMHVHPVWEAPTLLLLLLFRKKIVFTIHDQMMLSDINKYPRLLIFILKKIAGHKNIYWIAVNQTIKAQFHDLDPDIKSIEVIPAFLPVYTNNIPLNPEIETFIKTKSPLISVYANEVRKLNGKDLYGIDLALKAIIRVKKIIPGLGLIVSIPCNSHKEKLTDYYKMVEENGLSKNVLFFLEPINYPINLWRRSDIILRPTLTDGDSLIVREALSQGTAVIASDVIPRPENVILFKSENINDLAEKIVETCKRSKSSVINTGTSNYGLIRNIYMNLC